MRSGFVRLPLALSVGALALACTAPAEQPAPPTEEMAAPAEKRAEPEPQAGVAPEPQPRTTLTAETGTTGAEPGVASNSASGGPQPERLRKLARYYGALDPGEDDSEVEQARAWHKADYKALAVKAANGDEVALGQLLALKLDGAGAEIHVQNVEDLLFGLGDETFARVVAGQPKEVKRAIRGDFEWLQEVSPEDAPFDLAKSHPRTHEALR